MRGRPFAKGQSGNPGGRPKVIGHVRELARAHCADAITVLADVMLNAKSAPAARVAAATALIDRGFGRPGSTSSPVKLPELGSATDASRAIAAIVEAVASGDVGLTEAAELARLVGAYVTAVEATEFERRLTELEAGDRINENFAASQAQQNGKEEPY
jgi:hypothetical protein